VKRSRINDKKVWVDGFDEVLIVVVTRMPWLFGSRMLQQQSDLLKAGAD
jgi:hypothetical protein